MRWDFSSTTCPTASATSRLALFDVRGKTAVITGATGAFGALAAKVLAGAGANTVLAASRVEELEKVAAACAALGGKTEIVARAPRPIATPSLPRL
jgi:NAD(P)-dependent dehydrogenase (short-subunit alcohol dehydrogenase family)